MAACFSVPRDVPPADQATLPAELLGHWCGIEPGPQSTADPIARGRLVERLDPSRAEVLALRRKTLRKPPRGALLRLTSKGFAMRRASFSSIHLQPALELGALGLAILVVGIAASCGSEPSPVGGASTTSHSTTTTSSSSTAPVSTTTSSTGTVSDTSSTTSSSAPVCTPRDLPEGIPAGWEEYTDWSCACRFYVPASKAALPAPIVWEPCPESPGGIDCRQMRFDWTHADFPAVARNNFLDWKPGGTPLLAFRRLADGAAHPYAMDVVAEVDGAVRNAMIWQFVPSQSSSDPGCAPGIDSMAEGKWLVSVKGDNAYGAVSTSKAEGVLGGPVDQLHPPVLARFHDDLAHEWVAGANWIGHGSTPDIRFEAAPWPWTGQPISPVASMADDPEHRNVFNFVIHDDAIFWSATTLNGGGIGVWTPQEGTRPFIRWLGDATKKAGGFGTDGVDMVWNRGDKQSASDPDFTGSIMTAPYTTDPQAVKPRRLRSYTNQISLAGWSVGCGYATNIYDAATIIVRLSDGVSWTLPNTSTMYFDDPIGVTCDEVLVLGRYGGVRNIARVRLDSLGPGTPPD